MTFGAQNWLWMLVLVPLIWIVMNAADRRARTRLRGFMGPRYGEFVDTSRRMNRTWRRGLLHAALVFLVLALARPQWGAHDVEMIQHGADVVIAFDISNSMLAEDVVPSRLVRARSEMATFVAEDLQARIGLVLFAGQAFVQCPLTLDKGAIDLFLRMAAPDMISSQGTALKTALEISADLLTSDETSRRDRRAIILVTDGEDFEDGWQSAVARCVEEGIVIVSIGVGLETGAPIPAADGEGFIRDDSGEPAMTRFDISILETTARETGGAVFRLARQPLDRKQLLAALAGLGDGATTSRQVTVYEERFVWPLGLAFLLLLIRAALRPRRHSAVVLTACVLLLGAGPVRAIDLLDGAAGDVIEGVELYEQQEYEQALRIFETARADAPQDSRLAYAIGSTLARLGRWEEAGREFDRALRDAEDTQLRADCLYNAGTSALSLGDPTSAIDLLRESLRLDPTRDDAMENLEHAVRMLQQPPPENQQQQGQDQQEQQDQQQQQGQDGQQEEQQQDQEQQQTQNQQPEDEQNRSEQQDQQQQDQQSEQQQTQPEQNQQTPAAEEESEPLDAKEMSQERARSLLKALDQDEQELRRSVEKRLKGPRTKTGKKW